MCIFFSIGCNGVFNRGGSDDILTSKQKFSGNEGLVLEFFENSPPDQVFEESAFPVGIRLFNRGACDIGTVPTSPDSCGTAIPGYLSIGLEKNYIEHPSTIRTLLSNNFRLINPETITFKLQGKNLENIKGEQEVLTFNLESKGLETLDPQSEARTSTIIVTGCYKYQTSASADVCIDTDVYGFKQREKGCEVEEVILKDQGAPLAVTKIEPQMTPLKDRPGFTLPMFIITVNNKGNGEVIQGNQEVIRGACSSAPVGYKKWNRLDIKVFVQGRTSEREQLNCNLAEDADPVRRQGLDPKDGILNLKKREDRIRCRFNEPLSEDEGAFSTPIFIDLDYGYTSSISKMVNIKKILTY